MKKKLRELVGDVWIEEMKSATKNRCWVCFEFEPVPKRSLAVDHCHSTHIVRGLLCSRCNQVIGRMNDDPNLLRRMALYLERSRGRYPFDPEAK